MKKIIANACLFSNLLIVACNSNDGKNATTNNQEKPFQKGTYGYDVSFLKKYVAGIIELQSDDGNSKLLLSSDFQGRIITSTANGDSGVSFGWINYALIESGKKKQQFNPVGGEERFWMGPEGGQYSIYFKKDDSFNIAHWQVPAIVDTVTYNVINSGKTQVVFSKDATVTNYSNTVFTINIERGVKLLNKKQIEEKIHFALADSIHFVGYETDNKVKNTGDADWKKEKGLLSIWLLGMMSPSEQTTVIIPFVPKKNIHDYITDDYFGEISPKRLKINDSVLYLKCDGKSRGKIGLSPAIAKSVAASFDFRNNVLSIIFFPVDNNGLYVNSKWEIQKQPYKGDVVNSYNDGPLKDGTQLGPFYEIESSSPAMELKKMEIEEYKQTTCHFQGNYDSLRELAKHLLGIDLNDLKK